MTAVRETALLFVAALALRALLAAAASLYTGTPWLNLALLYDGHVYLLISRSFPSAYQGIHEFFPAFRDSSFFTGWHPAYPALVAVLDSLLRDTRAAALAVSWLCGALAVVLFHRLARRFTERPLAASLIFCLFPPTWLLTGSMAFVEPLFLCLVIAAFDSALREKVGAAVALGGLAAVTQKSGFLVVPILAGTVLARRPRDLKGAAPYALCLLPLAGFAVYISVVFHDPYILGRVSKEIYAASGSTFALPFQSVMGGLMSPTQMFTGDFWLRKASIALSALFYAGVLVLAWRRGGTRLRPLLVWLGTVLGFVVCLGPASYEPFPRYMLLAAPPAVLLASELLRLRVGVPFLAGWAAAAALSIAVGSRDASAAAELLLRVWPQGYFDSLVLHLQR